MTSQCKQNCVITVDNTNIIHCML